MVESPTYYHSLSPILRSLKDFDMENFPLRKEIVNATSSSELPEYLQQAESLDVSPIYKQKHSQSLYFYTPNDITNGRMDFERFLNVFDKYSSTTLEGSQCSALRLALTKRLAIIQGKFYVLSLSLFIKSINFYYFQVHQVVAKHLLV